MNNLANNGVKTPRSKILILGATGGTGRLIVDQALERGAGGHRAGAVTGEAGQAERRQTHRR